MPTSIEAADAPDGDGLVYTNTTATAAAECLGATPSPAPAKMKMFFTTSDLIERMNSAIRDANDDNPIPSSKSVRDSDGSGGNTGGFELQMKLPDGSYRRAEQKEIAAADFQTKMKQASERIVGFNSQQKMEWAKFQRLEGNILFARGEYADAMDVYLTCLVAMDQPCTTTSTDHNSTIDLDNNEDSSKSRLLQVQMDTEIKLPVLLNLTLCSLKLGMPSKAEKFCNFAMDTELGKQSPKASFFRGRARMLMGKYSAAESDLNNALNLIRGKKGLSDKSTNNQSLLEGEDKEAVILREKIKLQKLVHHAQKNRNQQRKAMEKVFKPEETGVVLSQTAPSLYPEKPCPPKIASVLDCNGNAGNNNMNYEADSRPTYVQWYLRMMGRCAQKILDIIGNDEEDEELDVPVDQDLLNRLMNCKKIA
jgi:hypothetical protein